MGRGGGNDLSIRSNNVNALRTPVAVPSIAEQLAYFSETSNILEQNTSEYNSAFDVSYEHGTDDINPYDFINEEDPYENNNTFEDIESGTLENFDSEAFAGDLYSGLKGRIRKNFTEAKRFARLKAGESVRNSDLDTQALAAREYYYGKAAARRTEPTWRDERMYPIDLSTGAAITPGEMRAWKNPRVLEEGLCHRISSGDPQIDTDALKRIIDSEEIVPENFTLTKSFDFYGNSPGPTLLVEEKWNRINERFESYLNDTDGSQASANSWIDENL